MFRAVIFDLEGTLFDGGSLCPGAADFACKSFAEVDLDAILRVCAG